MWPPLFVPVDLTKGEYRKPESLRSTIRPRACGQYGDLTIRESHAILTYLGDKSGKMWPTSAAGITEKAGFSFEGFPKVRVYFDAIRSRPARQKTGSFRDFSRDPTIVGFYVDFWLCRSTIR